MAQPQHAIEPGKAEQGAYLTMASIFASGGYHLLLGEDNKVLTTAYYPNYGIMSQEFVTGVRRYYDFIVRYGHLLYDADLTDVSMTYTGGVNSEIRLHGNVPIEPNGDLGTVWTIVKKKPGYTVLQLINLVGIDNDLWEHGKQSKPAVQENIKCTILLEYELEGLYWASADQSDNCKPMPISYEEVAHEQGKAIEFDIPRLEIWTLVYVKWKQ